MKTVNWSLALVEQGNIDAAWIVAQKDDLNPGVTREQWVEWALAAVERRKPQPVKETRKARYLRPADAAKLIRTALKESFPGVKFSVRSRGGSVSVGWTDGPTYEQVHAVTNRFQGKDFDGWDDSTSYREPIEVNGELVRFPGYVLASRHESAEFTRRVGEAYAAETGWDIPEIYPEGGFVDDSTKPVPGGNEPVARWFNRKLRATAENDL